MSVHITSAQIVITNVTIVNVTPSTFSVVWATSSAIDSSLTPSISVFADAGGVTNLAGQVGIEYYPLQTGNPALTNSYRRRINKDLLRQATMSLGLGYVRVSGCIPNTTYYYSLQISSTDGQQTVWPATGPLPVVKTPLENAFALQSQELVITLIDPNSTGSIIILSNTNTASVLAAVVGDGAAQNQAFFSVNDLIAAEGNTNYLPVGNQEFTATLLRVSSNNISQTYSLDFSTTFVVSQSEESSLGSYVALCLGSAILRAGDAGNIPISLNASGSLTNLSFVLNLPTNRISNISIQPVVPQLNLASVQLIAPDNLLVTLAAAPSQNLQGTQQVAQLYFTTVSNQSSAFVPLAPQSLQGLNSDATSVTYFATQAGRLVIVGNESLLEASLQAGFFNLTLYGIPGASYQIQYSTNLANAGGWSDAFRVPMTNIMETFSGLDASEPLMFYRAYEFTATQPMLAIEPFAGATPSLVLYGTPWSAYEVDYTTNLSSPTAWSLLRRVPLMNSFQLIKGVNSTNELPFYRAFILNAAPPILEAQLADQNRSLLIYGLAGTNYLLQYSTNLSEILAWYSLKSYTLTNPFQLIADIGNTNPVIFYRVKKQ